MEKEAEKGLEGQRATEPGWETPEQACLLNGGTQHPGESDGTGSRQGNCRGRVLWK